MQISLANFSIKMLVYPQVCQIKYTFTLFLLSIIQIHSNRIICVISHNRKYVKDDAK